LKPYERWVLEREWRLLVITWRERGEGGGVVLYLARELEGGGRNRKREIFLDLTMEKREEGGEM
jgi:hypothetical protein